MSDRVPTEQDLNAYVDGELSTQDRARVAHAIAGDPVIANQVAALARLKAVVAGLGDEHSLRLEDLDLPRRRESRITVRVAASVVLAVLLGGLAVGGYWTWRASEVRVLVAQAKRLHLAWLAADTATDGADDMAQLIRTAARKRHLQAHIPDMRSAKLTLTDVAYFNDSDTTAFKAMQLRYTGRRGCRVSLWLSQGPSPLTTTLTESDDGPSRGFYWRVDNVSYAMFATGMDTTRFTLLARNVYEATRDRREPPVQHKRELRIATESATPCRA